MLSTRAKILIGPIPGPITHSLRHRRIHAPLLTLRLIPRTDAASYRHVLVRRRPDYALRPTFLRFSRRPIPLPLPMPLLWVLLFLLLLLLLPPLN